MASHLNGSTKKSLDGKFLNYDHITFYVGNAKQAASYYTTRMGFKEIAYQGLETGSRQYARHVVKQNKIIFVFVSPYEPDNVEVGNFLKIHGDAVKDMAIEVENLTEIVRRAQDLGAEIVKDISEESDEFGTVRMATLQTYGHVTHTLVERNNYSGTFLPGYKAPLNPDCLSEILPPCNLLYIDHCVGNQPESQMEPIAKWYERILQFKHFWSVDERHVQTENSGLRSTILKNSTETIVKLVSESGQGKKKSQITEFIEYNGGAGVQHIALYTDNIIESIRNLRARGMAFMSIPDLYYDRLRDRLTKSKVQIKEDIAILQELNILIDYDDDGYLLQIFSKNMQDRPTLFLEVIQRCNHNGFGAGNIKSLFEAIELDQIMRGNLV